MSTAGRSRPEAAGSAAEGWVFSATFVDPARLDSAAGFVRAYEKRYAVHGVPVGAAEAYDAAGMVMTALTAAGTGHVDPGTLAHRLRALSYRGVTRTFAFDASTGAVQLNSGLFLWQVRRGEPVFLGQYQQVTRA